jgi:hypothetical protein
MVFQHVLWCTLTYTFPLYQGIVLPICKSHRKRFFHFPSTIPVSPESWTSMPIIFPGALAKCCIPLPNNKQFRKPRDCNLMHYVLLHLANLFGEPSPDAVQSGGQHLKHPGSRSTTFFRVDAHAPVFALSGLKSAYLESLMNAILLAVG